MSAGADASMLWGERMFQKVCNATKFLIDMIRDAVPRIDNIVTRSIVRWDDILYPRYNNTTEIIP